MHITLDIHLFLCISHGNIEKTEYYKYAKWGWVSPNMVKKVQNEELNGVGGAIVMDFFYNMWKN